MSNNPAKPDHDARKIIGWQRFWAPRTGSIDLSDGGFMVDPNDELRWPRLGKLPTLPDLATYRALGLLGEPGIGKSVTLRSEFDRARGTSDAGTISIHFDLRAFSNEAFLYHRLFESPEFLQWKSGSSQLVLFLDSLDEALLRIDSIANLLAAELPRFPTDRMSVRIACRTAVWPEGVLEPALRDIWGEKAVGVFELAPLRRKDVIAAAEEAQIKAEDFIAELHAAAAVPFAIKPLTLNLLLALRNGRLPRSIGEIYSLGCLSLCDEQNASRRDAGRRGDLSAPQRLRLASRLAAITMLANRYAIWTGPATQAVPDEDVPLSDIATGREEGAFQAFDVTEDAIRETLDTGLFSSRGPGRMGWAHQSYAEFLAASYLVERNVAPDTVLKILLHPSGGLVPQLAVVAAWLASLSKPVRDSLIASEPVVLLRGDLVNWHPEDLSALTVALLDAFDQQRANDFVFGISRSYAKLAHPGLAAILRPYIVDQNRHLIARRAALMIAEACAIKELAAELLALALDESENYALRARAVSAFGTCGAESEFSRLIPLAKGEAGPDPNDDIKGQALEVLWPAHITAKELFATIGPSAEGYVGSYVMFLTKQLPSTLSALDLVPALGWATAFIASSDHMGDYHRKQLADAILIRGWEHFEEPALTEAFVTHVLARLHQLGELLRGTDYRANETFLAELKSNTTRRRAFLVTAAVRPIDRILAIGLVRASLLQRSDFEWLLAISPAGSMPNATVDQNSLCAMILALFVAGDPAQYEALYDVALNWQVLHQALAFWLDGIAIDSPQADSEREMLRMQRELAARTRPPPITPPPAERVENCLARFEGGEIQAWWILNCELPLGPESRHYGFDYEYMIWRMPGWQSADEATRERILTAAERYLSVATPEIGQWLGTTSSQRSDLAAYRAIALLKELKPAAYEQLTTDIWKKWASVVVAVPRGNEAAENELHDEMVRVASAKAPLEVAHTAARLIVSERARANAAAAPQGSPAPLLTFFSLRALEKAWENTALKEIVFEQLRSPDNSAAQFGELLDALLRAKFEPARDFAMTMLGDPATDPARAIAAAAELTNYYAPQAWPVILPKMQADDGFATELMLRLAHQRAFQTAFFTQLSEGQVGDLFIWMARKFPHTSDQPAGQAHFVGPHESAAHARDAMLSHLVNLGTTASVAALRTIVAALPDLTWLGYQLIEAEQIMRAKTWAPLFPQQVLRVATAWKGVLVRSPEDLLELLANTLGLYERELHGEQTPVRALWDRQADNSFRPVEEDALSDHVRLFLKRALVESGIVVNREVEVSRVPGAPIGTRTDIKIDALQKSSDGKAYDTITAVIETKGCWNAALFSALEAQLYNRYMIPLGAPVGIYLVGWFDKPKWDDTDPRKARTPEIARGDAQTRLKAQTAALPAGYTVEPVVLDCHAH